MNDVDKDNLRVGAILSGSRELVKFLGWGHLEGFGIPDHRSMGRGPLLGFHDIPDPKIRLDSGQIVWGCECRWGTAEFIYEKLKDYEKAGVRIEVVDIDAERNREIAAQIGRIGRHKCER